MPEIDGKSKHLAVFNLVNGYSKLVECEFSKRELLPFLFWLSSRKGLLTQSDEINWINTFKFSCVLSGEFSSAREKYGT